MRSPWHKLAQPDSMESRYARDEHGRLFIDISTGRLEDLYHYFDRSAPYIRRDLDPQLTDYLIDCARELGKRDYVIRFTLDEALDVKARERIASSINGYFLYLADRLQRQIAAMLRKSLVFLLLGLAILSLAVWVSQRFGESTSTVASVFSQGLTVAAWVSLWESLATLLVEWLPHRREIALYRKLAVRDLLFNTGVVSHQQPG